MTRPKVILDIGGHGATLKVTYADGRRRRFLVSADPFFKSTDPDDDDAPFAFNRDGFRSELERQADLGLVGLSRAMIEAIVEDVASRFD